MSHHYSGPDLGFPGGDARLDFTDLYAFPKPGDPSKSILVMNVHPSVGLKPPGPTTPEPFAPDALYELKIDTDGDAVADIAYPGALHIFRARADRDAAPVCRALVPRRQARAGRSLSRERRSRPRGRRR